MAKPLKHLIADEVRSVLTAHGVTQQELADRLGVRQYWVSRRLTYKAAISADELVRIAGVLGEPVSRFVPEDVAA
jgi:transcriptional regulator with XRE-family HTH domain